MGLLPGLLWQTGEASKGLNFFLLFPDWKFPSK